MAPGPRSRRVCHGTKDPRGRTLPPMVPMIRAAGLRGFVPLVERLGGDADGMLARFGLARHTLDSDEALIPITANDLVLDTAAAEVGCPDLGLRLAEAQDLSVLGPLAVVIEPSSTVAEALASASRYMFVHSPTLRFASQAVSRARPRRRIAVGVW
ncbi:AraC family transcriptional regulator ligand-binding domain-containing protein [Streptomyces sp. NPDC058525]|uniref:AraC family transcriptional regulator ligand-binding domain-containing protein n=1 Tax=unclassified Streptomyces TaxID=2593676 RepID=UPI0036649EB5